MPRKAALGWTLLFALPLAAGAGGTHAGSIVDGDVHFQRTASSWGGSPQAFLWGASSISDDTYQLGWWSRIPPVGGTPEAPFLTPTASLYAGNESIIDWSSIAGSFSAQEHSFVFDAGLPGNMSDGGYVTQVLTISNLSGSDPLSITIFHFLDFNLEPFANDDTALRVELETVEVYDAPITAGYWAGHPTAHRIDYESALLSALNNSTSTSLSSTGSPFGPGDFGAANQWNLDLPPNGSAEIRVIFGVNIPVRCGSVVVQGIFCDGFESAQSNYWSPDGP
jgi:hypothetical protein